MGREIKQKIFTIPICILEVFNNKYLRDAKKYIEAPQTQTKPAS